MTPKTPVIAARELELRHVELDDMVALPVWMLVVAASLYHDRLGVGALVQGALQELEAGEVAIARCVGWA